MFSRKPPHGAGRLDPTRASKREISLRIDAFVLASFLTILLALTAGRCPAATSSPTDTDGMAISDANSATEAGGTTPPDTGSRLPRANNGSIAEESNAAPAFTSNPSPFVVSPPPSGALKSADEGIHLVPSRCLVFNESLCQALKNRRIVVLGTMQTAALISDGITTRQFLRRGYTEVDPVARVLIGSKPTWGRMAPLGAVQVVAGMWLAERMAMSRRPWVRRFWWLPQMMGIAGNAAATAHNFTLH